MDIQLGHQPSTILPLSTMVCQGPTPAQESWPALCSTRPHTWWLKCMTLFPQVPLSMSVDDDHFMICAPSGSSRCGKLHKRWFIHPAVGLRISPVSCHRFVCLHIMVLQVTKLSTRGRSRGVLWVRQQPSTHSTQNHFFQHPTPGSITSMYN